MPANIVVPELGESVIEATVANWLKQEGERVSAGEAVVELETDKVDLEVGASQDGVLARIEVQPGQDVKVGDVLGVIEEASEETNDTEKEPTEATVAVGEADTQPEEREVEDGQAQRLQEAPVGGTSAPAETQATERVTPVARRLAQELGVNLAQVRGSGSGGRITREDVERAIEQKPADVHPGERRPLEAERAPEPQREVERAPAATPPPVPERDGLREERVRMSRRRRTIAQRLVEVQQTAAILTTFNDVDMTAIMELRRRRRESFEQRNGVKLGIMSFFVKATIGALKQFPQLNAEIQGDEIVLKHYYDIGIAIGAEEGLVVPVLRDADRMSFAEVEKGILDYAERVREGRLTLEDLRGGTFSITNGGVFGSLLSTPILNPPQVGILGMHRIEDRPVARNGELTIRPMMYLALSYDHRIVDGREAVQFLVRLKELLEDPEEMLLEG